jgi:hypothetical protein
MTSVCFDSIAACVGFRIRLGLPELESSIGVGIGESDDNGCEVVLAGFN